MTMLLMSAGTAAQTTLHALSYSVLRTNEKRVSIYSLQMRKLRLRKVK